MSSPSVLCVSLSKAWSFLMVFFTPSLNGAFLYFKHFLNIVKYLIMHSGSGGRRGSKRARVRVGQVDERTFEAGLQTAVWMARLSSPLPNDSVWTNYWTNALLSSSPLTILHPPLLHQAYLSKAALSSHFMLPADTANLSYSKLDASSLPSVLTHPFTPPSVYYAEGHSRLVISPILPSPRPTVSPHEAQPAKLPLSPWRHGACLISVAVSLPGMHLHHPASRYTYQSFKTQFRLCLFSWSLIFASLLLYHPFRH